MADPLPLLAVDPCGRATALRALYEAHIQGGTPSEVTYRSGAGVQRTVKYAAGSLDALRREMEAAEAACAEAQGLTPTRRRHAIRAGWVRY